MPGTVTMFETMYDAMNAAGLKPAERAAVYDACMEFSLHGKEPELEGMAKAIFLLIKPALCCSIKKKQNGSKTKAKQKQNESKTEAKEKQNANDSDSYSYSYSITTDNACMAESISARHPRNAAPRETIEAILGAAERELEQGHFETIEAALAYLDERTAAYAAAVAKWSRKDRNYIPAAARWYEGGMYAADEATWERAKQFDAMDPSTWGGEENGVE